MKLVIDGAIIARLEPAKELLAVEALHHIDVARIALGASPLKELDDLFLEVVITGLMQVVGGIALSHVATVV